MRLFHPCKECVVQPVCKNPCDKYFRYKRTYTGDMQIFLWIILSVVFSIVPSMITFMIIGDREVIITLVFITSIIVGIALFAMKTGQIHHDYEKRFERRKYIWI